MASGTNVLQNPGMILKSVKRSLLLVMVATSPLWVAPARAGLGSDAASVLADGAELHGVVNSVIGQQYDVQEIAAEPGMRVREYLTREGVVFAVSWTAPVLPDLQRLLGARFFEEYTTALAALNHAGLHRSVRIALTDLVVESGGHLRAYAGRAYLPALIPAGVSVAELR
jgi:hypothetical protein